MTEAGGCEGETRELLQAPARFSDIFLGCGKNHVLPIDTCIGDEQDASIAMPVQGDLAGAMPRDMDWHEVWIKRHGDAVLEMVVNATRCDTLHHVPED